MDNEDHNFVNRCLNGDGEAYSALVEKYYKVIFRLARKILKNYDDAEEITQSVFVKAYENLNKYNPRYKFFSWLYRITINETLNFSKKKSYTEEINESIANDEYNPDKIYNQNELGEKIQDALMELDMLYRLPVVLKHFLNYSYKELSDLLGIPEKTVKSRLFTGRQLLKDILVKKSVFQDD
ncbi:MAG: RNA polymerase sigma factor [Ignavibacteriaceae bacterium]